MNTNERRWLINGDFIMLRKASFVGALVGVILGFSAGEVLAQSEHENHSAATVQNNQFKRIEQPLGNKVAVTLGGLGILGLQLWWFLLSKPKLQKAVTANGDFQEVDIIVDGGYDPSRILVQAGKPVRLKFKWIFYVIKLVKRGY
jgi:plastocyanin domain-containing protein